MKGRTEISMKLYHVLLDRGYPHELCDQISRNLNTDWTANRMLGYLSHYKKLPMEATNAKWNELMYNGFATTKEEKI